MPHDEEKEIESNRNQGNAAIIGPGLGDLLTEGNQGAVFDLERTPGPLETRLERMEDLLNQLIAAQHAPRVSTSTFVGDGVNGKDGLRGYEGGDYQTQPHHGHDHRLGAGQMHDGGVDGGHTHPHPFVPDVAGAEGRPHFDAPVVH